MYKTLSLLVLLIYSNLALATILPPLALSELSDKSQLIVLAHVTSVKPEPTIDRVRIEITDFLKGNSSSKTINLVLYVRGGLREFDPILKVNDIGVFYLRKQSENLYTTAYGGSIAVFKSTVIKPLN